MTGMTQTVLGNFIKYPVFSNNANSEKIILRLYLVKIASK